MLCAAVSGFDLHVFYTDKVLIIIVVRDANVSNGFIEIEIVVCFSCESKFYETRVVQDKLLTF